MRKIFLLCVGLGCNLILETKATAPGVNISTINIRAIVTGGQQIPNCTEEELTRFMKACPAPLLERFRNEQGDVDMNDDFPILNSNTNLLTIAINGNCPNIVCYLIGKGANLENATYDGHFPIHTAVCSGSIAMTNLLLNNGASINQADNSPKKLQPLHFATAGSAKMVDFLLSQGADPNGRTQNLQTPLHCAVSGASFNVENVLRIVNSLIERNADVNARDSKGNTPLHLLASYHSEIVPAIAIMLVDAGANLALMNKKRETVFDIIKKRNNQNLMNLLNKTYPSILNCSGEELTRFLKECPGCPRNHRNYFDWSRIDVNADVPVKIRGGVSMKSLLHIAAGANCPKIVQYLINEGADVNLVDGAQWGPIHSAALHGFTEIVNILISKGADVNKRIFSDLSPLHFAVIENFPKTAKLLLSHHADVNAKVGERPPKQVKIPGGTALHISMFNVNKKGTIDMIQTLIENGADVSAQDLNGNTPLHILAISSKGIKKSILLPIVKMIMNANSDPNLLSLKNQDGETVLDVAKKSENKELITLLCNKRHLSGNN